MDNLRIPSPGTGTIDPRMVPYPYVQPDYTLILLIIIVVFLVVIVASFLVGYLLGKHQSRPVTNQ